MTTAIEYALMAGASYFDNRNLINRFPTPQNWVSFNHQTRDSAVGWGKARTPAYQAARCWSSLTSAYELAGVSQ